MPPLTAILIAHNEEQDLPRALASLQGVSDEIVLVDSGSTDRTLEIARQFGARVFTRPFAGFAEQKNYAAAQAGIAAIAPGMEGNHSGTFGLRGIAPHPVFGRLDPPFRLVSRHPRAPLPTGSRPVFRRAARERATDRTVRTARRSPP